MVKRLSLLKLIETIDLVIYNIINRWYEIWDNRELEGEELFVELEDIN